MKTSCAGTEKPPGCQATFGVGEFRMTPIIKRSLIVGLVGTAIIIAVSFYLRPAFIPETSIRASLLAQTPIGSSMDEVRAFAQKQGWIDSTPRLDSYMIFPPGTRGVEVTAFSGLLWRDPFPYRTQVQATWQFDFNNSNRLYDICVNRRTFD
jgi:hypothetical protein